MKSFQFNQTSSNEDFERILKYRKRKVAKQQVVFALILAVILLLLGVYIYNKVVYTEFDGYVSSDVAKQRAPDDLFIKNIYVNVGSFVVPGDTLYSFIYTKPLIENISINDEPDIEGKLRDMNLKYANVVAEMDVLRVTIENLRKQIAAESHNIAFGLSSNSHKMDLQRELRKAEEELRAKRAILNTIVSGRFQMEENISRSLSDMRQSIYLHNIVFDSTGVFNPLVKYRIATDSAIVTDIPCVEGTCMAHSEEIMSLLPINMHKGNYGVWTYVPMDKISKVMRNYKVQVIYNDEMTLAGRFGIVGVRTEELPEELRSNFARHGRVLIAQVRVDEGQSIPLWALADGTPVRIRMNNFTKKDARLERDNSRLIFETGHGLTRKSKLIFDSVMHNKANKRHTPQCFNVRVSRKKWGVDATTSEAPWRRKTAGRQQQSGR